MHNGFMQNIEIKASTDPNGAKDNTEAQIEQVMKGINLFADSNVPSFFRYLFNFTELFLCGSIHLFFV